MTKALRLLLLLSAALAAWPALAAKEYRADTLLIMDPVAHATPPGAKTGAVYFTVDNASNESERLVRASTPIAGGVSLHQMAFEGGVMKMRAIPSVEIGPGGRLELKPDGYHLMLVDLKEPLRAGETFPLMLTFERAGTIRTMVTVEPMGAASPRSR
jgi:copper(I)-binding protein